MCRCVRNCVCARTRVYAFCTDFHHPSPFHVCLPLPSQVSSDFVSFLLCSWPCFSNVMIDTYGVTGGTNLPLQGKTTGVQPENCTHSLSEHNLFRLATMQRRNPGTHALSPAACLARASARPASASQCPFAKRD